MPKLVSLVLLLSCAGAGTASADCPLFLLHERDGDVSLERTSVAAGASRKVPLRPDGDVLTFVLPLGEGKSSDLVQKARGGGSFVAACRGSASRGSASQGEALAVTVSLPDGRQRELPPVATADWAALDVRVNVTGGNGVRKAFAISRGGPPVPASGPVLDLFGGRLPLAPGDYAITTETTAARGPATLAGEVALRFDGEHVFANGRIGDGPERRFVLDTAAPRTVLARGSLPAGTATSPLVEERHDGTRASGKPQAAEIQGAGGAVGGAHGTTLGSLTFGGLRFENTPVLVLPSLPEIGGAPVDGILGLDLLRRAGVAEIRLSDPAGPRLVLESAGSGEGLPFTVADNHLFLEGSMNGNPVGLVVDTGAKVSLLAAPVADRLGLERLDLEQLDGKPIPLRGLDGREMLAPRGVARSLTIANASFQNVAFALPPDLAALAAWGLDRSTGILGNDFWGRFARIEIDFRAQRIRLVSK